MTKTNVSVYRHLLKTITWRVVGTIDTMLLGWFVSGDIKTGLTIGGYMIRPDRHRTRNRRGRASRTTCRCLRGPGQRLFAPG